ncbi:MAG: DUF1573 domain-containing protein [Verrucomicrobiota bacterium]
MKRQVLAALVAVGMFSLNCRADEPAKPEAAPSGGPKIQLDKTVYDFGSTSLVSKLEGVFIISNVGDAPLEKIKAQPSCGCTSAPMKTDKLAPGEKTELAFTVNVGAMNRGHLEKHITITSSDPKQPSVNLTLKADIVSVYEFNPQSIMVGDLRLGSSTNTEIQVKRTDGKPLGVTKVEGAGTFVRTKLEATEGSNTTAIIRVEIVAEGVARRFNDSVRVFGENATQPLLVIPVGGRFVGDIALSQESLFWGVADSENWPGPRGEIATTRKIIISSNLPDQKLELTNLNSSIPELKVALKPVNEGKSFELVAILEKLPKESATGTIKFDTNLKSQPQLEIKVSINILKRG